MIDFVIDTEIARAPAAALAYVIDPGKLASRHQHGLGRARSSTARSA
jgi:hypothetical protein